MELLKLDDVHLTYPPRFRRPGDGGGGDGDDGSEAEGGFAVDEAEERRERPDDEEEEPTARGQAPVVALRGVSLTVSAGDAVGVLGAVGSGRTTLLSVISGVLRPDEGKVQIRGRATGLTASGAGFFGDLTVRDNLVRNAMLMGMPRRHALELVQPIAEFAGLPDCLDQTVRSLSRAHTKRLAYSAALHAEPTVFLGDEELVVGPPELREAGLDRLAAFPGPARALVVVSNRREHLKRLCNRAVVLAEGAVAFDGSLDDGLAFYLKPRREGRGRGRRRGASAEESTEGDAGPDEEPGSRPAG